jgi:gliding motility-associated-like protein
VICPTECEVFNLQATDATSYTWEASCPSLTPLLGNNATASVCSDAMPLECQLQDLQIIGTATNACGSSSSIFLVRAEPCSVRIPNVITPNGDATNNNFVIEGIENYPGTTFKAYNRNGSLVYESDNYRNNWNPRDLNEGTYFYVVELPFGATTVYKGTFTILK